MCFVFWRGSSNPNRRKLSSSWFVVTHNSWWAKNYGKWSLPSWCEFHHSFLFRFGWMAFWLLLLLLHHQIMKGSLSLWVHRSLQQLKRCSLKCKFLWNLRRSKVLLEIHFHCSDFWAVTMRVIRSTWGSPVVSCKSCQVSSLKHFPQSFISLIILHLSSWFFGQCCSSDRSWSRKHWSRSCLLIVSLMTISSATMKFIDPLAGFRDDCRWDVDAFVLLTYVDRQGFFGSCCSSYLFAFVVLTCQFHHYFSELDVIWLNSSVTLLLHPGK